ncbi:MAG: CdaR family protein [Anaerolineales bacterium]|nr:CdaR family protein [Anaerolineales bacterium]MCS7246956.1 CdaR family protein [Anaerolineales bacterium]MDW8160767.1 CdaR family protein [Anaerolineales bacterium]MDW8447690.1 CdaR family protein [Anaerolineales bacterium]
MIRGLLRWLRESFSSLSLAFFLSLIVWVSAVLSSDPTVTRPLPQPVTLELEGLSSEVTFLEPLPSSVNVTLRAPQSVWERILIQPNLVHAWLDLTNLSEGEHELEVKVRVGVTPYHVVKVIPEEVSVRLERVETKWFPVSISILGEPALGYQKGQLSISPGLVQVSGARSIVERVKSVQGELDINGAAETQRRPVRVRALDQNGAVVDGVRLVPDTVSVNQVITLLGGYRNVVIKVVTIGEPAEGYWLTNISVSPPNVVVFSADPQIVDALPGYVETEAVDLTGLSDDVDLRVPLNLPSGVELAGEESVLVRLNIAALEGSLPMTLPLDIVGLSPGLGATLSPDQVDVLLSGPIPVLKNLKASNLRVIVDLSGLGAGEYQISPRVDLVPESVKVASILPENVSVVLAPVPSGTATPSPTPGLPPTLTPGPTPTRAIFPVATPTP